MSHLGAEGDLSKTLLHGNFLGFWTNQENLRAGDLKEQVVKKSTNVNQSGGYSHPSEGNVSTALSDQTAICVLK